MPLQHWLTPFVLDHSVQGGHEQVRMLGAREHSEKGKL